MSAIQKWAIGYATLFLTVVAMGHIPFFVDSHGLLLGGFRIDFVDDVLHGVSGLWAAYAAWKSPAASRFYFRAFGTFYTFDAFLGFLTGYGSLDLLTAQFGANAGYSMHHVGHNIAVNLPHFIIGPLAMLVGFVFYQSLAKHGKKKAK